MPKLMKYEFRKNRGLLLIFGIGLVGIELFYLYALFLAKDMAEQKTAMGVSLLFVYSIVCFFTVFLLTVLNYSRELGSKSSYLIFMTPNSSYAIILSKMLYSLILGIVTAALLLILGIIDYNLLHTKFPDLETFRELLSVFLENANIPVHEILMNVIAGIISFLASFFASVSVCYLAITLGATFLYNFGPKLKGFLCFLLVLALLIASSKISSLLPVLYKTPATMWQSIITYLPATIFNIVLIIVCVFACGKLLDKKVSL